MKETEEIFSNFLQNSVKKKASKEELDYLFEVIAKLLKKIVEIDLYGSQSQSCLQLTVQMALIFNITNSQGIYDHVDKIDNIFNNKKSKYPTTPISITEINNKNSQLGGVLTPPSSNNRSIRHRALSRGRSTTPSLMNMNTRLMQEMGGNPEIQRAYIARIENFTNIMTQSLRDEAALRKTLMETQIKAYQTSQEAQVALIKAQTSLFNRVGSVNYRRVVVSSLTGFTLSALTGLFAREGITLVRGVFESLVGTTGATVVLAGEEAYELATKTASNVIISPLSWAMTSFSSLFSTNSISRVPENLEHIDEVKTAIEKFSGNVEGIADFVNSIITQVISSRVEEGILLKLQIILFIILGIYFSLCAYEKIKPEPSTLTIQQLNSQRPSGQVFSGQTQLSNPSQEPTAFQSTNTLTRRSVSRSRRHRGGNTDSRTMMIRKKTLKRKA